MACSSKNNGRIKIAGVIDPLVNLQASAEELLQARRDWISSQLLLTGRTEPLRVLVASNTLGCGGAEYQILRLLPHLNDLGVKADHFYYADSHFLRPRFVEKGIRSCFLDRDRIGRLRFLFKASGFMRQHRYDIVHAFTGTANIYARVAAILAQVPVIIGGWRNRPMDTRARITVPLSLLNYKSNAWVINASTNAEALSKLWGMSGLRTYVLPNALDFDSRRDLQPVPFDSELENWIDGRLIIGAVGTISKQKNFDLFLDVAKQLRSRSQQVCFCLIGTAGSHLAALEEHLRSRVERENLSGYVRLLGRSDNVAGLLPHFCVFLLTSDWEGCPNVVIEAMRAKLPVVMTNCTDTKFLVDEGVSGYVVPLADAQTMAQRTNELLDDAQKRKQFGRRARQMAKSHFSAPQNAWLLAQIYVREWKKAGYV